MEVLEIGSVIVLGILMQFVSAILGPRVLSIVSMLLIVIAAGVAAFLTYHAFNSQYAGIGQDAQELAIGFGIVAIVLWLSHALMRKLFLAMARASHA